MGWFSDRFSALAAAAGHRRYVIGGIITATIAFSDYIRNRIFGGSESALLQIPSWVYAVFVGLGFVLWWLLEELVRLRRQIKGARFELARLRAEGVAIRNDGMGISSETDFAEWERRALIWNDRVIESMRKISEADAEWFSILDVVTAPRVGTGFKYGPFQKLFGEHDLRVKRLGKMIYRLWKD
jgi:hypothetical protein